MKPTVSIDRDGDGVLIVECPSIPGYVSHDATKEEASKISKKQSIFASKFERNMASH